MAYGKSRRKGRKKQGPKPAGMHSPNIMTATKIAMAEEKRVAKKKAERWIMNFNGVHVPGLDVLAAAEKLGWYVQGSSIRLLVRLLRMSAHGLLIVRNVPPNVELELVDGLSWEQANAVTYTMQALGVRTVA